MMREQYWGLFWSTGMPEAWLMSRGPMGTPEITAGQGAEGRPAGFQPSPLGNLPGGPRGSY